MKYTIIVAGLLGCASASFVAAAPASAVCAKGLTSIPCTIVENVQAAPGQAQSSLENKGQYLDGIRDSPGQLNNVGCPANDDGTVDPCGLPAVPGQFGNALAALPGQVAAVPGLVASAPGTALENIGKAPSQFISAINNGGTADPADTP